MSTTQSCNLLQGTWDRASKISSAKGRSLGHPLDRAKFLCALQQGLNVNFILLISSVLVLLANLVYNVPPEDTTHSCSSL